MAWLEEVDFWGAEGLILRLTVWSTCPLSASLSPGYEQATVISHSWWTVFPQTMSFTVLPLGNFFFIRTIGKTAVLVSFPVPVIKHPEKSNIREKPFALLHSSKLYSIMAWSQVSKSLKQPIMKQPIITQLHTGTENKDASAQCGSSTSYRSGFLPREWFHHSLNGSSYTNEHNQNKPLQIYFELGLNLDSLLLLCPEVVLGPTKLTVYTEQHRN